MEIFGFFCQEKVMKSIINFHYFTVKVLNNFITWSSCWFPDGLFVEQIHVMKRTFFACQLLDTYQRLGIISFSYIKFCKKSSGWGVSRDVSEQKKLTDYTRLGTCYVTILIYIQNIQLSNFSKEVLPLKILLNIQTAHSDHKSRMWS